MVRTSLRAVVLAVVLVATACGTQDEASPEDVVSGDEVAPDPGQGGAEEGGTTTTPVNPTGSTIDTEPSGRPVEGDETPTEVDLSGGGSDNPPPELVELAARLVEARQLWAATEISTYHYRVELSHDAQVNPEWFCGLGPPFTVQIVDGEIIEAKNLNGCLIDLGDAERPPLSVDEWFDFLDNLVVGDPDPFLDADVATSLTVFFSAAGLPSSVRWAGETSWTEVRIDRAATGLPDTSGPEEMLAELAAARATWDEAGITAYQFQIESVCFCDPESIGPFEVTVRDGEVVEATRDGGPISERAPVELFTVPGLFAAVEGSTQFDVVAIEYDIDLGFPTVIDADPLEDTTDDESRTVVTQFVILDQ